MEQKYKNRIRCLWIRNLCLTILVGQRIWFIIFDSTYGSSDEPLWANLDYSVFEKWKKQLEQPAFWPAIENQSFAKDTENESGWKCNSTEKKQRRNNNDSERAKIGLWAVETLSGLRKRLDNLE